MQIIRQVGRQVDSQPDRQIDRQIDRNFVCKCFPCHVKNKVKFYNLSQVFVFVFCICNFFTNNLLLYFCDFVIHQIVMRLKFFKHYFLDLMYQILQREGFQSFSPLSVSHSQNRSKLIQVAIFSFLLLVNLLFSTSLYQGTIFCAWRKLFSSFFSWDSLHVRLKHPL